MAAARYLFPSILEILNAGVPGAERSLTRGASLTLAGLGRPACLARVYGSDSIKPSASVTPTEVGILLRSDLGTFQLTGSDMKVFVSQIAPLLDGTRNREEIAGALPGYSQASVLVFWVCWSRQA